MSTPPENALTSWLGWLTEQRAYLAALPPIAPLPPVEVVLR